MTTHNQILQFLSNDPIAMAGVSRNPKKFGRVAYEDLVRKGLPLIPVNPNMESVNGINCYPSIKELPNQVNALLVMTHKNQTASVIREALEKGIRNIWIQQSSETPEVMEMLREEPGNFITNQCILMHYKPDSFHKFHRNLKKFFGRLPK